MFVRNIRKASAKEERSLRWTIVSSAVGISPKTGIFTISSTSLREWILLSNKNLRYKIPNGIKNPNKKAPNNTIDFLGETGNPLPYAASIIFKLSGVAAALTSLSSRFCNKSR
ncbi:hypothetical protein D3C73_1328730 [compost metagenome]